MQAVQSNGGTVTFIELTADPEDLIDRVSNESRKKHSKLSDENVMHEIVKKLDQYTIPFVESITVDTSKFSAEEAAKHIINITKF